MTTRRFHKPIHVQLGRLDRDRVVVSTQDAAQILLRDWPLQESQRRLRAMKACLDVLKQKKPPSAARDAFISAAKEAGVYLGDFGTTPDV